MTRIASVTLIAALTAASPAWAAGNTPTGPDYRQAPVGTVLTAKDLVPTAAATDCAWIQSHVSTKPGLRLCAWFELKHRR